MRIVLVSLIVLVTIHPGTSMATSPCPSGAKCSPLPDDYYMAIYAMLRSFVAACSKQSPENASAYERFLLIQEADPPFDLKRLKNLPQFTKVTEQSNLSVSETSPEQIERECKDFLARANDTFGPKK